MITRFINSLLSVLFLSGMAIAERKVLPKREIHREIISVGVRPPPGARGDDYGKQERWEFDPTTGDYIYTYHTYEGEERTVRWDPPNRVDLTVACDILYDPTAREYTYIYTVKSAPSSKQIFTTFVVSLIRLDQLSFVRELSPDGWRNLSIYNRDHPPPPEAKIPQWVYWSASPGGLAPGEEAVFKLVSKLGPRVTTCWGWGKPKTYPKPPGVGEHLLYYDLRKDGINGLTLGPGTLEDEDATTQLETFFEIAEEWGWIDSGNRQRALGHIGRGLDRGAFQDMVREIKAAEGVESEVRAFIDHFGSAKGLAVE